MGMDQGFHGACRDVGRNRGVGERCAMSMDTCARCCAYVDTDDDMDCYQPAQPHFTAEGRKVESYKCICERCREIEEMRRETKEMEP